MHLLASMHLVLGSPSAPREGLGMRLVCLAQLVHPPLELRVLWALKRRTEHLLLQPHHERLGELHHRLTQH